jgi:hypothetical protein
VVILAYWQYASSTRYCSVQSESGFCLRNWHVGTINLMFGCINNWMASNSNKQDKHMYRKNIHSLSLFDHYCNPITGLKGAWGRGDIAPTHSRPRHYMGVSGMRHAPTALYPGGKDPQYPLYRRLGGPQSRSGHRR